jgi:hypothetical protein
VGRPAKSRSKLRELLLKIWIAFGALVFGCEFVQRRHQRFRHETFPP